MAIGHDWPSRPLAHGAIAAKQFLESWLPLSTQALPELPLVPALAFNPLLAWGCSLSQSRTAASTGLSHHYRLRFLNTLFASLVFTSSRSLPPAVCPFCAVRTNLLSDLSAMILLTRTSFLLVLVQS